MFLTSMLAGHFFKITQPLPPPPPSPPLLKVKWSIPISSLPLTFPHWCHIAEAVARMRRRSASSIRSSGRRRVESARTHRYVERSLSACSGMSRPGTAPASRSRVERGEEPSRFELVERQEAALETKDMVMPIGGAEIEEATSVHEDEQGELQGPCRHISFFILW